MADDELDELYRVKPDEFTALRTRLAAAAKQRGDTPAAKRITGARKPTTAAWIVNTLVHRDAGARRRLTDLGERLRAAHAEMDGEAIRNLSREQRALVDELGRAAFASAGLSDPSAALREDVTGTLQAAIADPEVAEGLGRLAKAERWSGFGEFGDTAAVFTPTAREKVKPRPTRARPRDNVARAALTQAEHAKAEADDALAERQTELAMARLRLDDARARLQEAERKLTAAEEAYEAAKEVSRQAAALVKQAKAKLK
jgi:hypothetical protein